MGIDNIEILSQSSDHYHDWVYKYGKAERTCVVCKTIEIKVDGVYQSKDANAGTKTASSRST